ncbi:MAG: RsmF rRNA methyltransferase first C-terminal domain-containing protein [Lachnospiraceae bacterium]|nr:RsmF rRNA methyltransferase first C-terminal domain-containing protein [Lachnospiraceae bacterium]
MLPELFLNRMREMLGDEYGEFAESLKQERYHALRLNAVKINRNQKSAAELAVKGLELPFDLLPVEWAENGYYYDRSAQPGRHPYHEAGVYYIQEPSAMAPVPMLEVKPGERVLDLCAAPGGKSTQLAAALMGDGLLICNEINPQRAKILSANIERMGVWNACVTNETPERLSEFFPEYFDKILVDAPCSGEGMFRKNEEACAEWSPENVEMCAARQACILDEAAGLLRRGGRLVYSTCTFSEAENEGNVESFVKRHPEFRVLSMKRLWPHKIKGEGHFAAILLKEGEIAGAYRSMPLNGFEKGISPNELGDLAGFADELLLDKSPFKCKSIPDIADKIRGGIKGDNSVRFIKFGDNLYLIPEEMPSLKGLRVLRAGLHIGMLRRNRLEPAHALALAINPSEVRHVLDLDSSADTIMQYLNGQTFTADGEKGWYLVCVDGFGAGWGKLAGGIMKNHYPKGLRINL